MKAEYTIYYKGNKLDYECCNAIADSIIGLSLRKGDSFELLPFNHFKDEKTDFVGKVMGFHTNLKILDIKYSMIHSWNSSIKNKIEIFLDNTPVNLD